MQPDTPSNAPADEALVSQALHDPTAFDSIVTRYYYMVFSVAYAHLQDPDAAEELTQETFVRALLHIDKLRQPRTLPAWLNRIARNESLKWIEKRQVRSRLMPTIALEAVPMNLPDKRHLSPDQQAMTENEREVVCKSLSILPGDVREIVVMHYVENLGKSEIARRLNLHPSSVGRKLQRALDLLRNDETVAELRGFAPRLASRAQETSAVILGIAALSAGNKAALAAQCADAGLLAATMPATVSHGGFAVALASSSVAKIGVAVIAVALGVGAVAHFTTRGDEAEHAVALAPGQVVTVRDNARSTAAAGRIGQDPAATRLSERRRLAPSPTTAVVRSSTGSISIVAGSDTDADFLEGRVVDSLGNPVEHALVDVHTWYPRHETYTDRNGRFRIEEIVESKVQVQIGKDGYSPFYTPQQPLGVMAEPVVLGTRTAVEGLVTDESGVPVPGLKVKAAMPTHDGYHVLLTNVALETVTDRNGKYRIPLWPSAYTLEARKGDAVARLTATVTADETCRVDLQLRTGLTLRARVIDSITSAPVSGAMVWSSEKSGVSNTSGILEIHGLSSGNKEFYFKKAGYARFWSENSPSDNFGRYEIEPNGWHFDSPRMVLNVAENTPEVTIVIEKAARICGTVLDPDQKPAEDIQVCMVHAGIMSGLGSAMGIYDTRTDASGHFELFLPASKNMPFRLLACDISKTDQTIPYSRRRWADAQMDGLHAEPGQEIDNLVLRLARPGTIRGQLVRPAEGSTSAPRARVTVQADWPGLHRIIWAPEGETDAEGRFELKFVPPGESELRAVAWYSGGAGVGDEAVSPAKITLAEGEEVTSVTLTIAPPKPAQEPSADQRPRETVADQALAEAVNSFNKRAGSHPIGGTQPPLTEQEVVAAIRGWNREEAPVDEPTYELFQRVAESGIVPGGMSLKFTSALIRDGVETRVWWVDLCADYSKMAGWTTKPEQRGYVFRIRSTSLDPEPGKSNPK